MEVSVPVQRSMASRKASMYNMSSNMIEIEK